MSLDRSLRSKGGLTRRRNVLKRSERLAQLTDEERWDESQSVFGLPKVAVKRAAKSSKAKAAEPTEETPEGAEAPEAAEATKATESTETREKKAKSK